MTTYYQQGDVLLFPVEEIPKDTKKEMGVVLAEGEVTGHAHRLQRPVEIFKAPGHQDGDDVYMSSPRRIELTHEEHATQVIPPGKYRVSRVREYDYATQEARRVQD